MKFLISGTICIMLMFPLISSAASLTSAERARILEAIVLLKAQIESLQAQLDLILEKEANTERIIRVSAESPRSTYALTELREATFYRGDYVAVYEVRGLSLLPVGNTKVHKDDQDIFERFTRIAGSSFVENKLSELRLYDDEDADHDGFVERFSGEEEWILGINIHDIDLKSERDQQILTELLIHEYGHILIDPYPELLATFEDMFWTKDDARHSERVLSARDGERRADLTDAYYRENSERFVTPYATTNLIEDAVESFVSFVLSNRKASKTTQDAKINFFYDYPEFVDARDHISDTL